ncbi:hypothetical protein V6Z12_D06G072800 [Gossypium hirsutum]
MVKSNPFLRKMSYGFKIGLLSTQLFQHLQDHCVICIHLFLLF